MVDPNPMSRRERQIMDIVYAQGSATVRTIQEKLEVVVASRHGEVHRFILADLSAIGDQDWIVGQIGHDTGAGAEVGSGKYLEGIEQGAIGSVFAGCPGAPRPSGPTVNLHRSLIVEHLFPSYAEQRAWLRHHGTALHRYQFDD